MTDVATVWNNDAFTADYAIANGDLASDAGLETAVLISLLTDRLADPDDVLPDTSSDRRGWWGDLPLVGANTDTTSDHIGSRLWLLARAKATDETAAQAVEYCEEALAWMIEDGICASVAVQAQWITTTALGLVVTLVQASGATLGPFSLAWRATV